MFCQQLNGASRKSLLIIDELGRGTSTADGYAIAFAVAGAIADRAVVAVERLRDVAVESSATSRLCKFPQRRLPEVIMQSC